MLWVKLLQITFAICISYSVCDGANVRLRRSTPNMRLLLWTRNNRNTFDTIVKDDLSSLSKFRSGKNVYIMTHGWHDSGTTGWIMRAKNEFLNLEDCNVISVDWRELADSNWYPGSCSSARKCGEYTANVLDWIRTQKDVGSVHIIGHSLGAHLVGYIGKHSQTKIERILGLDPAKPGFDPGRSSRRLSKGDAAFVEIIHTNSGSVASGCISISKAIGDADFYANDGKHQPGCDHSRIPFVPDNCSHQRAPAYFVESIRSGNGFYAVPCSSWKNLQRGRCECPNEGCALVGRYTDASVRGSYYFETNGSSPYAKGRI